MKKWVCAFFLLISTLNVSAQAGEQMDSLEVIDGFEHCIQPESLVLISGKLYMSYQDTLVPLSSIRYAEEGVFAVPEASMIMVKCPRCKQWYIAQFGHDCKE